MMSDHIELGRALNSGQRRKAALMAASFVAFAVAALVLPHTPAAGAVVCPFRALTELSCPGCGMTRACIYLFYGEFGRSLTMHPFAWVFVFGYGAWAVGRLVEAATGRRVSLAAGADWKRRRDAVLMGCLIALVAFGACRLALEMGGFLTPV